MLRAVLDLVFPHACMSCAAHGARFLCGDCEARFPWIEHRCLRCGLPARADVDGCADCASLQPAFATARAPARYEGVARDVLMTFKLGGERRAASRLAATMVRALPEVDLLTAVPSDRKALAARGFNPAEELARAVAALTGVPYRRLMRKVRTTADQAGLGRLARRANLTGAFSSGPVAGVVLLVDDVMTTGATADVCARALLSAGARSVHILTFARAGRWSKQA